MSIPPDNASETDAAPDGDVDVWCPFPIELMLAFWDLDSDAGADGDGRLGLANLVVQATMSRSLRT